MHVTYVSLCLCTCTSRP